MSKKIEDFVTKHIFVIFVIAAIVGLFCCFLGQTDACFGFLCQKQWVINFNPSNFIYWLAFCATGGTGIAIYRQFALQKQTHSIEQKKYAYNSFFDRVNFASSFVSGGINSDDKFNILHSALYDDLLLFKNYNTGVVSLELRKLLYEGTKEIENFEVNKQIADIQNTIKEHYNELKESQKISTELKQKFEQLIDI